MGKHAYLIVSNSNFNVLRASLKMIDDSRNDIYLMFDKKSKVSISQLEQFKSCVKISKLILLQPMIINWAGYSQIRVILTLFKTALDNGEQYDYIHFLQGSDLPIKTQDEIHKYFNDNYGAEYVMIYKNSTQMANNKAWYRHYFCHNRFFRTNKIVKALNFALVKIQKLFKIRKNIDINLYQGSALFSITSEFAKFIVENENEIYKRFRWSLAADEVFMQTILMNSQYANKIIDLDSDFTSNARMIDRTRPEKKNSPHVWRENESEYLLGLPNCYCFARKFDENIDFDIVKTIYKSIKNEEYVF